MGLSAEKAKQGGETMNIDRGPTTCTIPPGRKSAGLLLASAAGALIGFSFGRVQQWNSGFILAGVAVAVTLAEALAWRVISAEWSRRTIWATCQHRFVDARLVWASEGKRYECRLSPITILGRKGSDVRLTVEHERVDPLHAVVVEEGDEFSIYDLGTSWGTWVNDQQVPHYGRAPLRDRDIIALGDPNAVSIRFERIEEPDD